jgi:hypothetical protein
MASLRPFEQIDAGGVDSRSNPINMPRNRALRCLNWVPRQAGFWELRYGYSTVTMSTVTASAIHSIFPYRTWDGNKYVIFGQGTMLNVLNTATGAVTTPTRYDGNFASSAKAQGYFAANRFHYGNGTDQQWYDGTAWRANGLRALVAADIQNVTVVEGVRELTTAQASTITLTSAGGGSFPASLLTGYLMYVAIFDTSVNEIGPATIFVGSGRVTTTLNQKITVGNLPNLSSVNTNWVKLIAGTIDGGNLAGFFTNTSTNLTSCMRSGTTLTVVATAHGLSTGDVVIIVGTLSFDTGTTGTVYAVTVVDANTFTLTLPAATGTNTGAVGAVRRIVQAGNAATSVDVLANTLDAVSYQVNQTRGLAASTIGGSNPGYQFYASICRPNGGGHVGNRIAIGPVALQTAYRSNWRIAGLPNFFGLSNGELNLLIGRTGDGAQVPYPCADNALNWAVVSSGLVGVTSITITQGQIDGQHELPTRNGTIPTQCNMFAVAGDFIYAGDTGSPYLRRSGDMSQNTERGNTFTGRAEQSWAPDDVDTFPTGEALTGMFEVDQEVLCGTLHDSAISVNLAGIQQWVGPWAVGIAGIRAGTKCGSHGFYWVTGDKQLATLIQGVPLVVSEEYEAAELAQIGSQFLPTVEAVYYRDPSTQKDELRIEAQKSDGTPYTIIHDFRLREIFSAPSSPYGQGYSSQFVGPLATVFTSALVRDTNGKLQVYSGASTGQLYQLYTGADDVGNQYTADLILLSNAGTMRPSVPFIDWYGDANVSVSVGRTLQTTTTTGTQFSFDPITSDINPAQSVPGAENDFLYRFYFTVPEMQHMYMRFQLTSHSADGTLALSSPPHCPLENYGRIYELIPAVGDERER